MTVYAGMVTGMDRNIGRLVNDLRRHREIENSLIIFLCDNGACAEWEPFGFDLQPVARPQPGTGINVGTPGAPNVLHRGAALAEMGGPGSLFSYGSGWANASNTPFRFYKHYDHEGGISTPLIVHWPAGTKRRGEFERRVGHVIDLMATCAEAAGATYPRSFDGNESLPMEGCSLMPALQGEKPQLRTLFWEHEGNRAVRAGRWKLVGLRGGPWELYDFDVDRTEMHNIADRHPDIVARLAKAWDEWAARCWVAHGKTSPTRRRQDNGATDTTMKTGSTRFRLLLALFFLIAADGLLPNTVRAETRTAAALTAEAVWEAINAAKDGDTVQLPEGTAVWTRGWNTGHWAKMKAITIQGAGIDKTIIRDATSRAAGDEPFEIKGVDGKPFRITGTTYNVRTTRTP